MIRTHLLEELTRVLGEPRDVQDHTEWLIGSPRDQQAVRVVLNHRVLLNNMVHVLVFDPLQPKGESIVELSAGSMAEADAVIQRIKHIKSSHDGAASER